MGMHRTITDLKADVRAVRAARYGVIEVRDGQLAAVRLRSWPKFASIWTIVLGQLWHRYMPGDRVRLYYNQPRRFANFVALKYAVSSRGTTWRSVRCALRVMDEIARIKKTDALLCDAASFRISPRALARQGWEPHAPSRWHRNYIKRLYPAPAATDAAGG